MICSEATVNRTKKEVYGVVEVANHEAETGRADGEIEVRDSEEAK